MRNDLRIKFVFLTVFGLLLIYFQPLHAQQVSVGAAVSAQEVFRGEILVLQIQINGSDTPAEPDLAGLTDFQVENLGGQTRNSESISIINNKMNREVKRGYVFSYRLTPLKAGQLTIPSLKVEVEGKTLRTRPVPIRVNEPKETDDYKLRVKFSKLKCYVGEPITLTITWYYRKKERNSKIILPILKDSRFQFYETDKTSNPSQVENTLEGEKYSTRTYQIGLIGQETGIFPISQTSMSFEAMSGYQVYEDFFGRKVRQEVYKKMVIPANSVTLEVLDLPEVGRPANFTGHIGKYNLQAAASPTEANVGEPITLTVTLSGPEYLQDVELPPLKDQPELAQNFKIPEEMAEGKIEGKTKIFTQTIRATNPDMQAIPPIELAYFDTEKEQYQIARSKPIAVTIKGTRIVTAQDAEGTALPVVKSELREWSKGIAYNYEDLSVLENQQYGLATLIRSSVWLGLTLGPLVMYLSVLVTTVTVRRVKADPEKRQAKGALGILQKELKHLDNTDTARAYRKILESFQKYMGKKLRLTSGAITFRDIEETLRLKGVETETLRNIETLFADCEAAHYAGHLSDRATVEQNRAQALSLAQLLEGKLK